MASKKDFVDDMKVKLHDGRVGKVRYANDTLGVLVQIVDSPTDWYYYLTKDIKLCRIDYLEE